MSRKPRPAGAPENARWFYLEKDGERPRQTQRPEDYPGWTIAAELERPLARHERIEGGRIVEDEEVRRRSELEARANRMSRADLLAAFERLEGRVAALEAALGRMEGK